VPRGSATAPKEALEAARGQIAERIALLTSCWPLSAAPFRRLDDQVEREASTWWSPSCAARAPRGPDDPGQIVGVVREALAILPVASRTSASY